MFFNRPMDPTLLNTFAGYGGAVDQRAGGAIEAARYGAVAAIVRSVTLARDNVPHTGSMGYRDSIPRIPGVAIGIRDADLLSATPHPRSSCAGEDSALVPVPFRMHPQRM